MHDPTWVTRVPVALRLGARPGRVPTVGPGVVAGVRGAGSCCGRPTVRPGVTPRGAGLTGGHAAVTRRETAVTGRRPRGAAGVVTRDGNALESPDSAEDCQDDENSFTPHHLCAASDRGVLR